MTKSISVVTHVGPVKVIPTPTGVRLGNTRARVIPTSTFFGGLSKGQARKARKALRAAGFTGHAGAPRR